MLKAYLGNNVDLSNTITSITIMSKTIANKVINSSIIAVFVTFLIFAPALSVPIISPSLYFYKISTSLLYSPQVAN